MSEPDPEAEVDRLHDSFSHFLGAFSCKNFLLGSSTVIVGDNCPTRLPPVVHDDGDDYVKHRFSVATPGPVAASLPFERLSQPGGAGVSIDDDLRGKNGASCNSLRLLGGDGSARHSGKRASGEKGAGAASNIDRGTRSPLPKEQGKKKSKPGGWSPRDSWSPTPQDLAANMLSTLRSREEERESISMSGDSRREARRSSGPRHSRTQSRNVAPRSPQSAERFSTSPSNVFQNDVKDGAIELGLPIPRGVHNLSDVMTLGDMSPRRRGLAQLDSPRSRSQVQHALRNICDSGELAPLPKPQPKSGSPAARMEPQSFMRENSGPCSKPNCIKCTGVASCASTAQPAPEPSPTLPILSLGVNPSGINPDAKDSRALSGPRSSAMPSLSLTVESGALPDHMSERSAGTAPMHRHAYRGNWKPSSGAVRSGSGAPPTLGNRGRRGRRNSQDTVMSSKTKSSFLSKLSRISSPARKMSRFIQRTLGGLGPFKGMDTDQCPICYDNVELFASVKLECCKCHYFCADCITHFFRGRINEGRVRDLRCPLYGECGCNAVATEKELASLLEPDAMKKYHRFMAQQNDPTLRECPKCLLLVAPSTDGQDQIISEMMCGRHCITFCYYHSLQHVGRTCDEYARDQANLDRMEEKFLQGGGKQCPICGILTEKFSGCNQMTCGACHRNWCWICEEDIEGRPGWHYNPLNPRSCLQFDDSDDASPEGHRGWLMIGYRICALPAMLAATVLFIAACASTFLAPLFIVPLFALVIAWVPVAVFIHFCFIPLGGDERHIYYLLSVPFVTFVAEVEMLSNLFSSSSYDDNDAEVAAEIP